MARFPTERIRRIAGTCLGAFDATLFPTACAICGAGGRIAPFCEDCRAELLDAAGPSCPRCARSVGPFVDLKRGCSACRGHSLGFSAAVALGPFQGPIRHFCLEMKYPQGGWMARWMADLLLEVRGEAIRQWAETSEGVVAVPLHWWRHWRRGYNQSEEIADRLARRLGLPLLHPLRRVKPTPKLPGRGRAERAEIMRGAFEPRGRGLRGGRDLILVDDVLTTGATCGAAARALKKAGARRVMAAVLARAEGRS